MSSNNMADRVASSHEMSAVKLSKSSESLAQSRDVARESSAAVGYGAPLGIFRLIPLAAIGDHNWDIAPSQGELMVVARTTGDARVVAACHELSFTHIRSTPGDDIATMGASAFRNEKLYTVIEVDRDRYDLERGVFPATTQ
jgi:hypothetical protein